MTINKTVQDADLLGITFNDIPLTKGVFDGKFFAGRSITLEGHAPEGQVIKGWEIVTKSSSGTDSRQMDGERCSFVMPTCASLTINAILGSSSGIDTLSEPTWTWQRNGDQIFLYGVPAGTKVLLYDLRGLLQHSVVSDGSEIILPLNSHQLHVLRVGDKTIKL
jgi:hypothetical protein